MKQCILITGVLLAYISSFANEMTSYALHEYSPTQTQSDTKKHRIYVRDHLGSTRAVIDEAGELLQTVNYYASGVPFTLTQGETATDRLHSGKQFIDHQGLGYYDNSARMLDVLGGRFTTLDPMATDYGHLSPYSNCAANPLKYTDPDGRILRDENGNIVYKTSGLLRTLDFELNEQIYPVKVEIGFIYSNNSTPIEVFKNMTDDLRWTTNCHGTTFANGEYWIDADVNKLIENKDYTEVSKTDAMTNDIVVYSTEKVKNQHSMTIINIQNDNITVYGQDGPDIHNHAANIDAEGNSYRILRHTGDKIVTNEKINNLQVPISKY